MFTLISQLITFVIDGASRGLFVLGTLGVLVFAIADVSSIAWIALAVQAGSLAILRLVWFVPKLYHFSAIDDLV